MKRRNAGVPGVLARHAVLLLIPGALFAQTPDVPVIGRVLDEAGRPLAGAAVEVPSSYRAAETDAEGRFELRLPPGPARLLVRRIGYITAQVDLDVAASGMAPVVVELRPDPVALRGISVEAPRAPPLGRTVTTETVRQVPPLGEPDVFRAVVLLPGVAQPNDLKGRIHLAGGASDETGVRLDGHPLQDPFHLLGLVGAFNVAALERADVRIHHLPPAYGGRLSGVIDLESRRPAAEREAEGVLSVLSAGATVNEPAGPFGVDVLASGRITYLDRVVPLVLPDVPRLGFSEALLRVGRAWGGLRVEALAFRTADRFSDAELDSLPGYEPLRWRETLAGLRVDWRGGRGWSLAARASFDRATVRLDERTIAAPVEADNVLDSRRDWFSGSVAVAYAARRWRLEGGVGADRRTNRQSWVAVGLADEILSPNTPARFDGEESWSALSVFGAASVEPADGWSVTAGARAWRADAVHLAPRGVVAYRPGGGWTFEAAYDRRYQWDAQLEEPIEGSITPPVFLLDAPRKADVLAASARIDALPLPWGVTAALGAQAFRKTYLDRTLLSSRPPGAARDTAWPGFPAFERIPGSSAGLALSARIELPRDALVQGSYTVQRVREEVGGRTYPTSWDAPHTLALFGSVPLGRGWVFNAVFRAHSGRATTPVRARVYAPPPDRFRQLFARYLRGERNSIRVPAYRRLDIGLRRSGRLWGGEATLAIQVLNLLGRANPIDYDWQQYYGMLAGDGPARPGRNGLPIVPSVGLEVRW